MPASSILLKVKTREEVVSLCAQLKKDQKRLGFTSGTFDLLHPGHVLYLEQARTQCDVLIVGVNSDASVRAYKDPSRPLCDQTARSQVIAALASVDYVFIFEETNNNQNIELLKPDFYFKAGDYSKSELSSAPLVEKYGGKVVIIPLHGSYSSTSIIHRLKESNTTLIEDIPKKPLPAVFVDRDGTLVEHVEYLHEKEKLKVIPGTLEALKKLKDQGYFIVVVTNQPGIGLGYFTKEQFYEVNRELLRHATSVGLFIDKVYACPHSLSENCNCRKPSLGLIERACQELPIVLSKSVMIGDTTIDMALAKNAGISGILVKTGLSGKDGFHDAKPDYVCDDLSKSVNWILAKKVP